MPATNARSETLPPITYRDGVAGYLFGSRFLPRMAGAEDDPPADPKPNDPPADPKKADPEPFDKDRAMATIQTLRQKEREGKDVKRQLDAALEKLQAYEDKDKTDAERLEGRATEAESKLTAAQAALTEERLGRAVERAASKLGFHDPDDALALLNRKAVEFDEDGKPKNVEALLKTLAESKPHLVKAESDDGARKPAGGTKPVPPTPKPARTGPDDKVDDIYTRMRGTAPARGF